MGLKHNLRMNTAPIIGGIWVAILIFFPCAAGWEAYKANWAKACFWLLIFQLLCDFTKWFMRRKRD